MTNLEKVLKKMEQSEEFRNFVLQLQQVNHDILVDENKINALAIMVERFN